MTEAVATKDYTMTGHTPSYSKAPSPFLPGTRIQYAWDSTTLGALKTCPRLYQYIYLEGWASNIEGVHLRYGIECHKVREEYDRCRADGAKHEDAVREAIHALLIRTVDFRPDRDTKVGKYKNRDTLLQLMIDYLDEVAQNDPAQTYIMKDGRPAVELSFRFELDWGPAITKIPGYSEEKGLMETLKHPDHTQPYLLCGHLDRVVDFNDSLYVMDLKTSYQTLSSHYFDQWSPSNQMTLYTLASQVILDSPIKGVIIDAAQILLEGPNRFVRGFTYRTPDQLEEWMADLKTLLRQAEGYAEAGYWPMNDTACDKFGGCRFREVCSKSPQVRPQFLKTDFTQQPPDQRWNPLASRG